MSGAEESMKRLRVVVAIVLLLFGLGCLNYTKPGGLEHHRAVARQHGLPEPGDAIVYGGAASIMCGAALIGYVIAASRRAN
jgi:hypothetical protein